MLEILGLSGSLREESTNTAMLRALADLFPTDVQYRLFESIGDLPIFNPDREGDLTPIAVLRLIEQVHQADGLIISSPEYIHGIPGGLKNAFDWLVSCPEIVFKPILLLHASHRGDIALAALSDLVATVSQRASTRPAIRVPLLSRSPDEVRTLVNEGEYRDQLSAALSEFLQDIEAA